jgi:hypothetical protein
MSWDENGCALNAWLSPCIHFAFFCKSNTPGYVRNQCIWSCQIQFAFCKKNKSYFLIAYHVVYQSFDKDSLCVMIIKFNPVTPGERSVWKIRRAGVSEGTRRAGAAWEEE